VFDRLWVLDGKGVGKDPTSERLLRLVPELGLLPGILGELFVRVLVMPIGTAPVLEGSIFRGTQMLCHLLTVDLNHGAVWISLLPELLLQLG
jgi:hypothetical protein